MPDYEACSPLLNACNMLTGQAGSRCYGVPMFSGDSYELPCSPIRQICRRLPAPEEKRTESCEKAE